MRDKSHWMQLRQRVKWEKARVTCLLLDVQTRWRHFLRAEAGQRPHREQGRVQQLLRQLHQVISDLRWFQGRRKGLLPGEKCFLNKLPRCTGLSQTSPSSFSLHCVVSQCIPIDFNRSVSLICYCYCLCFCFPHLYVLMAERIRHWLDFNMIKCAHPNDKMVDFSDK